jgi:predicted transposase/invertase (TIGR01784 family)
MKAKYVNPFTDFGFKKIFGEEACKPILIDFLANLLPEANIVDLSFKDKDKAGHNPEKRKVIFDIYCENHLGEKIIVEMQKAKQNYFKDRSVYYATFPIQDQAQKGEWDFQLKNVYCVGILDFCFDDSAKSDTKEVIHTVTLKDQNNKVFYKKLKFVYLEMPHFTKQEHELVTRLDKWLYFIKHLETFDVIPAIFQDSVFEQAFEQAELSTYSDEERREYENSLKIYRDLKNVIDTAYDDGVIVGEAIGEARGEARGKVEKARIIGKKLKDRGISHSDISEITGLSLDEIADL